MTEGHGDDLYKYEGLIRYNFSSNIYSQADLGDLKDHLTKSLGLIERYPEPEPWSLEKLIAKESGADDGEVMVTNGATEAIYMIARCLNGTTGNGRCLNVIKQPTFSEYADACRSFDADVSETDNGADCKKVYWICNPNNPDGVVVDKEEILRRADSNPLDFFVIDQSYERYTLEPMIGAREAAARNNIIIIHSMTKRFCVPGLRIGHVVANAGIISSLKALRHPWSVNALAVEAGCYLVRQGFEAIPDIESYLDEAQRLRCRLDGIQGVDVLPTKTNFMLVHVPGHKVAELKEFLVAGYGILIRDASNFVGLDECYFRVAAQGKDADDLLVDAVKAFIHGDKG